MFTLFPLDEHDLPDRTEYVAVSAVFGAGVCIWANWILKRRFYDKPLRTLFGGLLGAAGGYALHKESQRTWRERGQRTEYRRKLALQYLRDNHPELSAEEREKHLTNFDYPRI